MQIRNIVVPTDFSPASDAAMRYATSVARDTGALLSIVHCEEPDGIDKVGYGSSPDCHEQGEAAQKLRTVTPRSADVAYTQHLLQGDPAESISNFARDTAADLIVMGTQGTRGASRPGASQMVMGSVAESVVRHSSCPVASINQPIRARRSV